MSDFKLTPTTKETMAENGQGQQFASAFPTQQFQGITNFPASRMVQLAQFGQNAMNPLQLAGLGPSLMPKREKVAIIGTAPSSRDLAPYNDPTWDIWVCSPGNRAVTPRVDAWFEIHKNLHWREYENYGKDYIDWLSKQAFPVFMQDKTYFPHAITFPADELIRKFGDRFFGSTFAWMVAYAIHMGYREIGLWGVDMASKDEYIQQRGTFQFWFHKCEELGIKVTIPPESDLLEKPTLYGYSDSSRFGRKLYARKNELLGRVVQMEQEKARLSAQLRGMEDNITYLKGAVEDIEYILSIWPRGGGDTELPKSEPVMPLSQMQQMPGTFVLETSPSP